MILKKSVNSLKCPKCGCEEVARTKRVSLIDKSLSLLGLYPYYCNHHSCRKRFYYNRR